MPDAIQDAFLGASYEAAALQELLFKYLQTLGLEKGDEPTYKRMNSFLLAHTETKEKVDTMTAKTKWLLKKNNRSLRHL